MEKAYKFPVFSRLSIITATIILAYGLTPFVKIPAQSIIIRFPWAVFNYDIDFDTIVSILVAFLAAFGIDWLIQTHPQKGTNTVLKHGIVPALTAWLIGVPLAFIDVGLEWWMVVGLGGILLAFIFLAEYLVVDSESGFHLPASLGLTAISFALFLVLAIALQASGLRLFLLLPAIVMTVFLLVARTLFLRTLGNWNWFWALGIGLLVGQIAIGLHYLPIQPLTFGLLLVAIAYPTTLLVSGLKENRHGWSLLLEPLTLFTFLFLLALFTNG